MRNVINNLGLDRKIIILIIVLTIIFAFPLYGEGIPSGHDLIYHFSRIVGSYELLKRGIFPAKLFPGFYFNFGYPIGLFYPTGLLYIASFLLYVGVDFILSYKIFIIFVSLITTISMYISSYGIFKSKTIGLISMILYTLSIYRVFTDLFYRGAIGEYIAFAFIPLAFWGLHAILNKEDNYGIVLGIGMFGLLVSHTLSTVLTTILLLIYALFNLKKILAYKKSVVIIIRTTGIVALLSCYYWLPMLEMMISDVYQFQTPWTNLSQNLLYEFNQIFYITPTLSQFPFGYELWLFILMIVLVIVKFKSMISNRFISFSILLTCILYVFTSNLIPVEYLSFLNFTQFPWRVFLFITFFNTMIIAYGLSQLTKAYLKVAVAGVFIFTTINYLYAIDYYFNTAMQDYKYLAFPRYSVEYHYAEFLPESANMVELASIDKSLNISQAIDVKFESDLNTYYIFFDQGTYQDTVIEVPLLFYKGYAAYYMNETESGFMEISKSDDSLININLKNIKSGNIKLFYNGTRIQKISFYVSVLSSAVLFIYALIKRRN